MRQFKCPMLFVFAAVWVVLPTVTLAVDDCLVPSSGPDVIVGDLPSVVRWGTIGGITGYSIGTTSCNIGDQDLNWIASTNQHPVIAQNMYRLKDARFEQIGMSWLKHGFFALAENLCCACNEPQTGSLLGVGCSDPYSASLNGNQAGFGGEGGLGPRSQVNASTGEFTFPYVNQGMSGDVIFKRLQVHNDDLNPNLNSGALYFIEGQYVTPDDAAARNRNNNASYRRVVVGGFSNGGWNVSVADETQRQQPALFAWSQEDPGVVVRDIKIVGDGLMYLGSKASNNGDGTFHYDYALYNMNSDRGARLFHVPVPADIAVTNLGFHDVDYHSGEPYDGADWSGTRTLDAVEWSTDTFDLNENANALRWGTLYSFRFDANAPPRSIFASVGLFKPGNPDTKTVLTVGPVDVPLMPLVAGFPHDRRKNRYISFDPNKMGNDGIPVAFKILLKQLTLGSCTGTGGFCREDQGGDDCNTCRIDGNPCISQPIDCAPVPAQTCDATGETCVNDAPDVGGTNVGRIWWVGPESPLGNSVHLIVSEPFRKISTDWPNPTHVGDCEIVPQGLYGVRAVNTDTNSESAELDIETTRFAAISSSWWADCVGSLKKFCGGDTRTPECTADGDCAAPQTCDFAWTLPDGSVNFDDIGAALALRAPNPQRVPPDMTWVDLHGNGSGLPGSQNFDAPNQVINSSDIQTILFAFSGRPYTFYDPADCPDVPNWP